MAKKTTTDTETDAANAAESTDQQTSGQPPAGVAQSEIGPITYGEGGKVTYHGENDPETLAAYHGGHPADSAIRDMPGNQARTAAEDAEADDTDDAAEGEADASDETPAETAATRSPRSARSAAPAGRRRSTAGVRKSAAKSRR